MCESKEFQLWLRRTLGQDAAREAELSRYQVPPHELKIEVKKDGKWVPWRE